jgi:hypothetical protein
MNNRQRMNILTTPLGKRGEDLSRGEIEREKREREREREKERAIVKGMLEK